MRVSQQKSVREVIENEIECPRCYDMMSYARILTVYTIRGIYDGENVVVQYGRNCHATPVKLLPLSKLSL
jgi:hypothetical protein